MRKIGAVKWFKGTEYGLICDENKVEYFVHRSGLKAGYGSLPEKSLVTFVEGYDRRKNRKKHKMLLCL